jgi:hypothetical protein
MPSWFASNVKNVNNCANLVELFTICLMGFKIP